MMVSQVRSTLSDGDESLKNFDFDEFKRGVISDMRYIFRSSKCAYKVTLDGD